jgi:serine/threonine protein kinase/Flp pilus assembly protein TadD
MSDRNGASGGSSLELARLIDGLAARLQAGEAVDVEAVAREHPAHAEEVRRLLPALGALDELSRFGDESPAGVAPPQGELPSGVLGDFRIVREVGRGGMGVVYEAEQLSLGRRVALKVLPFAATLDSKQLQRFHNEAKAAACLHHEHIIPVYFVGCERGVHYYAMQFIEGRTLAQLIQAQQHQDGPAEADANATQDYCPAGDAPTTPVAGLSTERSGPRGQAFYRQAAELIAQAAEALEHAHSLGIVHRDVKPANLLLGPGGKLWVGDFGLARLGADAGLTLSGDLLGTLRYMAPEQALARHGLVDHRADVYALGATLYELLTLRPAVTGTERAEVLRQIAFEEPAAPRKLDKAIPAELETITLKCLAKIPSERYPAAGELAEDLRRWLEDRPIKARPPTLRQRAVKWARRHRPVVGAAGVVLLFVLAAAGAFGWWQLRQQAETERQVELALQEATIYQGESKWPEALAAVRRAEILLDSRGGSGTLRRRIHDHRRDLDMISELEEIRMRASARWVRDGGSHDESVSRLDLDQVSAEYRKAFQDYGIDWEALDPVQAGELIRAQPIRRELIAALDHWARLLTQREANKATWTRLLRVARLADTDDLPNQVRLAAEQGDTDALKTLAHADRIKSLPPSTLDLLAAALYRLGAIREALDLLREAQWQHPGDYWINHDLARMFQSAARLSEKDRAARSDEAVRFYTAALAARPLSPDARLNICWALMNNGRLDESLHMYREMIRLRPDYAHARNGLGMALRRKGLLDEAITEFREAIRLKHDYAEAHNNLGTALARKSRLDEAIAEYQEAGRIQKGYVGAYRRLGYALQEEGRQDKLIPKFREAIRRNKDNVGAHIALGYALQEEGRLDEAIAEYREALRIKNDDAEAHTMLGITLRKEGRFGEAIAEFEESIRLDQDFSGAHFNLAWLLATATDHKFRDPARAVALGKRAVMLDPNDGHPWNTLGVAQYRAGDWKAAVVGLEKSLELRGGDAFDWFYLAMAHWQLGDKKQARQWYDKAVSWIDKAKPQAEDYMRLRVEAQALLGIQGSSAPQGKGGSPRK